jgi:DUF4097 and DUF4098 domain-containing protein YvlB
VHFVRFEDLIGEKEKTLTELFKFAFEMDDIEGTLIAERIKGHVEGETAKSKAYKPRTGKIGSNI